MRTTRKLEDRSPLVIALESGNETVLAGIQKTGTLLAASKVMSYVRAGMLSIHTSPVGSKFYKLTESGREAAKKGI